MGTSRKNKSSKAKRTAIDKQWKNNGAGRDGRDESGRFTRGHKHGFKPGESGNPGGRPISQVLSQACRRTLAMVILGDPQERTYADIIAEKMCELAAAGDTRAASFVADRAEGKPKQAVDPPSTITLEDARFLLAQIREKRMEIEGEGNGAYS